MRKRGEVDLFAHRQVLRLAYQGSLPFDPSLLEGERLRVLTFSASDLLLRDLALRVGEMEVVLGSPVPAQRLSEIAALQEAILRDLQGEVRVLGSAEAQALLERFKEGKLRLFLSRRPSHAKLFLVEREGRRYAIFGSANLSLRALVHPESRGGQAEILALVEDEEGVSELERVYLALRRESDPLRAELLFRQGLEAHDLPLMQAAEKEVLVLEVPREVPVVYRVGFDFPARAARALKPLEEHVRTREGFLRLKPEHVRFLRSVRRGEGEEGERGIPLLRPTPEGLQVGEVLQPYLEAHDPGVAEDARILTEFLEGYLSGDFLHEEEARAQVAAYFVLWCWFWAAPRMGYLLSRAHLEDLPPHAYPLYALVHGKANTGKTTFLRFLSRSLVGAEVTAIPGTELSQDLLRGIHAGEKGMPVVIDDVSAEDVARKVEKVVKGLYDVPLPYEPTPVVLSLNSSQNYAPPDEIRKRALLVRAMATLDTTQPGMVHRAYARAQRLYAGLGNRLYRAFLPRFLERLEGERDWLRASSETLVGLLGEALGHSPSWAAPLGYGDLGREYLEKVRAKVAEILGQHREGLEVKGESLVVRLGLDARRYARELPGWLVVEARGDLLILSRKGLAKLGIRQEAPFLERLRGLFRR